MTHELFNVANAHEMPTAILEEFEPSGQQPVPSGTGGVRR